MTATPSSARTPSSMSTRVSRSDMSMASTTPPGAGEGDPRDCVGGFRPGEARPPTQVRRRADLRNAVGTRHQDRAVHLLHPSEDPDHLSGAGGGLPGQRAGGPAFGRLGVFGVGKLWHAARRTGLEVGRDQAGRLMAMAGAIIRSRTAQAKNDDSESRK